ncbi:hypothetical protein [Hymenobacter ruber]
MDTPKPGAPDFDVDNASEKDYEKHLQILKRRADVAALTPTALTAETTTGTPYIPAPDDVYAVHPELGNRYFSKLAWDTLETKGAHGGWEVAVDKPADLK